jgi:hypothetical protein
MGGNQAHHWASLFRQRAAFKLAFAIKPYRGLADHQSRYGIGSFRVKNSVAFAFDMGQDQPRPQLQRCFCPLPKPSESNLCDAAQAVADAVERAVSQFSEPDDSAFGRCCEEYTRAAKGFAKLILAERIRRSFTPTIADGKSNESVSEKIEHAGLVRSWLFPWNLGLKEKSTGLTVQLFGRPSGSKAGSFALVAYNSPQKGKQWTQWSRVKALLDDLELEDVTDSVARRRQIER